MIYRVSTRCREPGTSNNYWTIDDLVGAYQRVREEARVVVPGHDWRLWDLHRRDASI